MTPDQLPACRHRVAEFYPGRWLCSSQRLVTPKGVTGEICRSICPYVDHEESASSTHSSNAAHGAAYGVAIGTYDSLHAPRQRFGTEAVELNLAVLRESCGTGLRILVCDDASPRSSQRKYREICKKYSAEFTTNRRRMGHSSGDMIVFHKAIRWAVRRGLKTVTKLSHRMLIDVPNWVQEDSELLVSSGFATQAQMLANFGVEQIRTECVMMVVDRWCSSEVLHYYRPRSIPYWNESHTFYAIAKFVDPSAPYPHFLPWHRLSYYRGQDRPPVFFRTMAGGADEQFRTLANRYGVALTDRFSTLDSCQSLDYM